jgi:hypothetical protein
VLFPHLGYAEAVYKALIDAGMRPHAYDVTVTGNNDEAGPVGGRELMIRAAWTSEHRFVKEHLLPHGFRMVWKHTLGWAVTPLLLQDLALLPLPLTADPEFIAETACDVGVHGLPIDIDGSKVGQWEGAAEMDQALAEWEVES